MGFRILILRTEPVAEAMIRAAIREVLADGGLPEEMRRVFMRRLQASRFAPNLN